MIERILNWLLDLVLGYLGLERKAKRDEQEQKARTDAKDRSDAAVADLGDGLRGMDTDPDNRDNRQ
jgi:hypothetical protein